MDRRQFLKSVGLAAGTAAAGTVAAGKAHASAEPAADAEEFWAILVDTTRCIGCRMCERACAEANDLPAVEEGDVFANGERKTTEEHWTVVGKHETSQGIIYAKRQCMHCSQPACGSACLTKAMLKTHEGPVIWRSNKCMGCRFCMVSCPFDMPKFEYSSAVPRIQKCQMCYGRLMEGEVPACVARCPMKTLAFGKRDEMLDEARARIAAEPDKYQHHIYGEHEVGGTGYLYLSAVPFEELGFRTDLGDTAFPEFTTGFLYNVPIVLTLGPAFLLGLSQATKHEPEAVEEDE